MAAGAVARVCLAGAARDPDTRDEWRRDRRRRGVGQVIA